MPNKTKVVMSAPDFESVLSMLAKFWYSTPEKVQIDVKTGDITAPSGSVSTLKYRCRGGRHQVFRIEENEK